MKAPRCAIAGALLERGDEAIAADFSDDPRPNAAVANAGFQVADDLAGKVVDAQAVQALPVQVRLAIVAGTHPPAALNAPSSRAASVVEEPIAAVLAHQVDEDVLVRQRDPESVRGNGTEYGHDLWAAGHDVSWPGYPGRSVSGGCRSCSAARSGARHGR